MALDALAAIRYGLGNATAITPRPPSSGNGLTSPGAERAGNGNGFGDMVSNAIQQLDQVQKSADSAALNVANGQGEIHSALITVEEASLAFQLALQVRNKVVEGYQEVMRMQV